jgi:hypothetical protein
VSPRRWKIASCKTGWPCPKRCSMSKRLEVLSFRNGVGHTASASVGLKTSGAKKLYI